MTKLVIVVSLFIAFSSTVMYAQDYTADIDQTSLTWLGEKVTGEHTGNIQLKSGHLSVSDGKIVSGIFEVDMSSITCTDLEDEGYNKKLIGHLKSDDFFGVAKYPTARFEILGSESIKNGSARVKGNLTIKGKTHPVEFRANTMENDEGLRFFANIIIDRTKYDIRYGSGSFFDNLGDKTIYDEFKIKLNMLATKK